MKLAPAWLDYVQVGDQILCTGVRACKNPKTASRLTPGKTYEVTNEPSSTFGSWVSVVNDNGKSAGYSAKWFSFTVPAGRKKRVPQTNTVAVGGGVLTVDMLLKAREMLMKDFNPETPIIKMMRDNPLAPSIFEPIKVPMDQEPDASDKIASVKYTTKVMIFPKREYAERPAPRLEGPAMFGKVKRKLTL